MTFQYNSNASYSTEDLASSNSTVDLVTQKIYLNESGSVQLKFMVYGYIERSRNHP